MDRHSEERSGVVTYVAGTFCNEAVKKPNFQNHFENFSQLEALRAIILLSLDIFFVQKMREKQGKKVFSQLLTHVSGSDQMSGLRHR
jgi:hypothetical protein